jgi:hypothetical protein
LREIPQPEAALPSFQPSDSDDAFRLRLVGALQGDSCDAAALDESFAQSRFPQRFVRLILILYSAGQKRIVVSRSSNTLALPFSDTFMRLLAHPRCPALAAQKFWLQLDFVVEPPAATDVFALTSTPGHAQHFEFGIDGLLFQTEGGKMNLFAPGDGYVRSMMSMTQLRDYLIRVHGEDFVRRAKFKRFRSQSWLLGESGWSRLYRGYPLVGALSRAKMEHAVELALDHIQRTQEADGKFLYYYDAALDTRRDHEHPRRDPVRNPYYNILRHSGGGLTCVFYEKLTKNGRALNNIRRAIDYLVTTAVVYPLDGREGAYIYSEKKSKLGGAGLALYFITEYQLASGDDRYRPWADRLAWHLLNQITASGEFIYYNIYLDQPVTEADNQKHFSFYYPGEAICGLAKYLHLVAERERAAIFTKLHQALDFLLVARPRTRASEYTAVPSDGWLMMGIKELWDFPEMRLSLYADFVFADAQQMMAHMYQVDDAPHPDYAGAFYYEFGDFPYADGARCEGLLGAYELAVKMGDMERAAALWRAVRLSAWAVMHLVNTEEAIYSAPNPALALGGIRFKYTRQWFRIDTIQHVASFYAKLLPYWDSAATAEFNAPA